MKIKENNVTLNVTLMSKIESCFCDVIVTKTAVTTLINSNMNVTLKNVQVALKQLCFMSQTPGFIRSLFALCSLFLRLRRRRNSVYTASLK